MKRKCLLPILLFSALWVVTSSGCSLLPKSEREKSFRKLHRVIPNNMKVRRPAGGSADSWVGPGGDGYVTSPAPGADLHCQTLKELFAELLGAKGAKTRACITSVAKGTVVQYKLRRFAEPYFEIDETKETPRCLIEVLPKIPVPREIVFQNRETGSLGCFSSRLDLESDELPFLGVETGVKWPLSKTLLKVKFPPTPGIPLESDEDLERLLMTWTLSPFFNEKKEILSRYVPQSLCAACLGSKQILAPMDPMPPYWPEE